jgi:hypothetical protein
MPAIPASKPHGYAVVDNSAVGPQISNRPFRMSGLYEDEVTLFCKIEKTAATGSVSI